MGVEANCCRRPETARKKDLKTYRGISQKKFQIFLVLMKKKLNLELIIQQKLSQIIILIIILIQFMPLTIFQIIIIKNILRII